LCAAGITGLALSPAAQAATDITRTTAPDLAAELVHEPGSVTSASYLTAPTSASPTPNAVSDSYGSSALPTDGTKMAAISNGNVRLISEPGYTSHDLPNNDLSGSDIRGGFDVTILHLGLSVPASANCLTVDFDFFTRDFVNAGTTSEENYYDGFLAELDPAAAWNLTPSSPTTTAPDNFAVDAAGRPVNKASAYGDGSGPFDGYNGSDVSGNAVGTGYDTTVGTKSGGALGWATAMTPVTPGSHTVDLSIFDRGDGAVDSAVLLDNLRYIRRTAGNCPRGVQLSQDLDAPAVTLDAPADGSTTSAAPSFSGSAGTAGDDSDTVTVKLYAGSSASGSPVQTVGATRTGGSWQATASTLAPATYTAQAEQVDGQGNIGMSAAHRFTVPGALGGGNGPVGLGPLADTTPADLTGFGLSNTTFIAARIGGSIAARAARKTKPPIGTTVSYTLSEAANVTFTVEKALGGRKVKGRCVKPTKGNKNKRGCTRYTRLKGSFAHVGKQGKNGFKFMGRLNGNRIAPGTYRLVGDAIDPSGNASMPKSVKFKIVKR
jgi:hypothetical protein